MARGGKREGAGRPFGTTKEKTVPYYRRVKPEWVAILDKKISDLKMEDILKKQFENCRTVGEIEKMAIEEFGCGELGETVENDWEKRIPCKSFLFHDVVSEESDRVWEEDEEHLYWCVNFDFANEQKAQEILKNAESVDDIRDIEITNIDISRETSDN